MSLSVHKPDIAVTMTEPAIKKARQEMQRQGEGSIGLRLAVVKSGCTGYMYKLDVVDHTNDDDHIFAAGEDVKVVVDPKSLAFVQGTEIDYVKEGLNAMFKFNNPNVQDSCGCGESFNVKAAAP